MFLKLLADATEGQGNMQLAREYDEQAEELWLRDDMRIEHLELAPSPYRRNAPSPYRVFGGWKAIRRNAHLVNDLTCLREYSFSCGGLQHHDLSCFRAYNGRT